MTDKRDLIDAYTYTRRRLVAAFVSGAPGGREVEPARPGRTLVAGVALAVLLLAGAAVAGVFHQQPDIDWSQPALISDEGSGALYVNLGDDPESEEPPLRAVVNVTSARLVLGADVAPTDVPSEAIAEQPKGSTIGIVDAPATVPSPDDLIDSGWSACTARGVGTRVQVAAEPDVAAAPEAGVVVRRGDDVYLIATAPATADQPASAHRYRFPQDTDEGLHGALGVAIRANAIPVAESWLQLFPEGGPLDDEGLGIEGGGDPLPAAPAFDGYPTDARIGDYFRRSGRTYLITAEGPVVADPFALTVLQHTEFDGRRPQQVALDDDVDLTFHEPPYTAARWPVDVPEGRRQLENSQACAVLDAAPGRPPAVSLGLDPGPEARAERPGTVVEVTSGRGAVMRAADWTSATGGAPYLVDDRGISYRLVDRTAVDNLGYGEIDWTVVPDVWLELFEPGVGLSRDAALCPPATGADPEPCQ
jgi:type VII secretion protein EccB